MKDFRRPSGQSAGRKTGGSGSFDKRSTFNKYQGSSGDTRPPYQAMKHQATCSDCGKVCQVPFRPNGKKPVFCTDCFGAKKGAGMPTHTSAAPALEQRSQTRDTRIDELKSELSAMHAKLDRLIQTIEAAAPVKAEKKAAPLAKKPAVRVVAKKKKK